MGNWNEIDHVDDQSIKKKSEINKAIAIAIGGQVCDRDQVGVEHTR